MRETDFEALCEIKNDEVLADVVAHWSRILRVADWQIEAHLVAEHELNDPQWAGQCSANVNNRCAQIYILRPETRLERWKAQDGKLFYGRQPMEATVVHELLHIWTKQCGLHSDDTESRDRIAMEQMVDSLATAFVGLHSYFETRDKKGSA